MIEVKVDSIRISLMNQQRVVLLKDLDAERYLAIWIGQAEADAITLKLRERRMMIERPLSHDLLKNVIEELGGSVVHIFIHDIRNDVYYARIVIELENGDKRDIDSRPSDAIALAVRTKSPIFIAEEVFDSAGIKPEDEIDLGAETQSYFPSAEDGNDNDPFALSETDDEVPSEDNGAEQVDESDFSAFANFLNSMDDLDNLDDDDNK
jgi:uncharacterized protein